VHEVAEKLDPNGLHLTFLDPHNLETLDFAIIERLAAFKHMDIIVHFSVSDETRNWDTYIDSPRSALDSVAPGWRTRVDVKRGRRVGRRNLFEYWCSLVSGLGLNVSKVVHEVRNERRVPLYWLLLLSRNPLPEKLWSTTTGLKQIEMFP
jgi:three-Cys-motif partner protein